MKKVISFAPGRAEWLGNHTDYNEGFVLSITTNFGTTITGSGRDDNKLVLKSDRFEGAPEIDIVNLKPLPNHDWANYVIGVASELKKSGFKIGGAELNISSDLPVGVGLASSAALEVVTGLFFKKRYNLDLERLELAKLAQAAEHNYAGVKCGLLDQISSLMGVEGCATFIDFRTLRVKNILVPDEAVFVIVHSGVKHALVAGEYNERRESCEAAARALGVVALRDVNMEELEENKAKLSEKAYKRAYHVVGENERVKAAVGSLESGDLEAIGKLMVESHVSSKNYFENSCQELDFLVDEAIKIKGCFGARLSGGGFGGATINLVKDTEAENFCQKIKESYLNKFGTEPLVLITEASGGAR